jgi:hypothetical protein
MTPHRDRLVAGEYEAPDLDGMSKADLLEHAETIGAQADQSMSKADIRAAIDKRNAGG